MLRLSKSDFTFSDKGVSIFFRYRKTDQSGAGHTVFLNKSDSDFCFVNLTEHYFSRLDRISVDENAFVIPKVTPLRAFRFKVSPHLHGTYNSCRTCFRSAFDTLGWEPEGYGLHSGKVGGVVHLRNNGASWRSINDFCGWTKDSAMPEVYGKKACRKTDMLDNILSF